jgi:hypothetical protein
MEARSVDEIPQGPEWQYEPKWDGFRCILARDAGDVSMFSKSGQDLKRYFPEIVAAALDLNAKSFILDGEIIVQVEGQFSFDDLLQRIHPAASRVKRLAACVVPGFRSPQGGHEGRRSLAVVRAAATPGGFRDASISGKCIFPPLARQPQVEGGGALARVGGRGQRRHNREAARSAVSGRQPGRHAEDKEFRSADCVIGGFRYGEKRQASRRVVGSILLGLYDAGGLLHHVGFSSGIKAKDKAALTVKLEDVARKQSFTGTAPGGPSRWSTKRSSEWTPVKPKYVVEVLIISPEDGFGTVRQSSDGGQTSSRTNAPWIR